MKNIEKHPRNLENTILFFFLRKKKSNRNWIERIPLKEARPRITRVLDTSQSFPGCVFSDCFIDAGTIQNYSECLFNVFSDPFESFLDQFQTEFEPK